MACLWVLIAVAQPPPSPAAAPPTVAMPAAPPRPVEWPREIGGKPVSHYIAELASPDPTARWEAVRTLPYFGPTAARQASKQLVGLLGDSDPGVRVNAILTLSAVGFENKLDIPKAVEALRQAIRTTAPGSVIRLYAARGLGEFGPDAHEALDALGVLVKDPAWETRDAAAAALGRAGGPVYEGNQPLPKRPASAAARMHLLGLLKDASKPVRLEAVTSLLMLGAPGYKDDDQYVRESKPLLDAVTARLAPAAGALPGEKDASVRLWLHLLALTYDDRHAPVATKELRAAVVSADPAVRVQGLTALSLGGTLAAGAFDEVRAAVVCVARMGPDGRKALPDLQGLAAATKDPGLKAMAEEAIRQLTPGAAPAGK